jgi:hypothetical protein
LGDHDTAVLELDAARGVFADLAAAPDVAWVDSLSGLAKALDAHGLTPRELEGCVSSLPGRATGGSRRTSSSASEPPGM